jgi:hypothetical protein
MFLSDLFISTYTTFANSKSPNIKCFGRLSIIFVVEFRRARVVLGVIDNDASLPGTDRAPFRSAKNENYKIRKDINNKVKYRKKKLNRKVERTH